MNVVAADMTSSAPSSPGMRIAQNTLTDDWFGQGKGMRDAGFDVRLEWSQFYQGLVSGNDSKHWQYGGQLNAQARFDLSKWGAWNGLSVTTQFVHNYGHSVNGYAGSIMPENDALYLPGIVGSDRSDLMALYVTQNFGDMASLSVGKLNLVELARGTPLRGGGGVDTFWNVNLSTPVTGVSPPTIYGAMLKINTQPVSFSVTVFDAQNATNKPLFSNLFDEGVNVMGTATLKTEIAGLTGYYGVKGIYSTKEGQDFSQIIRPPGVPASTKQGSWFTSFSFQQYLVQDPANPARGWGVFGEIAKGDGNPNLLEWCTYVGAGGSSLIPGRPDDRFGIAYFRYGLSNALKAELAPVFDLRDQSGIELFYNIAVFPWMRITGNVQFIRPASGAFGDSIYAGIGTYVRF